MDLASAAGCSPALVGRVEAGQGDAIAPRKLERLAQAVGARVVIRLDWQGEGLDRLLDADHAALVEAVVGILRAATWEVVTEATFAIFGERGSVDVLAWHGPSRSLLVVEVKSVLADVQDTLSRLGRKVRLAERIASPEWRPRTVSALLVVADRRTNRRRIETFAQTFANAFPDRVATVRGFIAHPGDHAPVDRALRGLWFLPIPSKARIRQRVRSP